MFAFEKSLRPISRSIIRFGLTVMVVTTVASPGAAASHTDAAEPLWTVTTSARNGPVVDGSTIIIPRSGGIDARAATGALLWHANDVADPTAGGPIVYGNRQPASPTAEATLAAFDARNGHELWSRPDRGGTLVSDGHGVVAGNLHGIVSYDPGGATRWKWNSGDAGGYTRLLLSDRYVIALSVRQGALSNGEIDTFERRSGRPIGSQSWFGFGELLALDAQTAYGVSDFPGNPDTGCRSSEFVAVSLGAVEPDHRDYLVERRADYVLEDLAVPTPAPPGRGGTTSSPCNGDRGNKPAIVLAGQHVVLTVDSILGVFDRVKPGTSAPIASPFVRYHDATFVGGPYAGRLYVARPGGLDAMSFETRHEPRFHRLIAEMGGTFTVAGIGDRLYASDGKTTTVFDANTLVKRTDMRLGCAHLRALTQTGRSDVFECDETGGENLIVAVPL